MLNIVSGEVKVKLVVYQGKLIAKRQFREQLSIFIT